MNLAQDATVQSANAPITWKTTVMKKVTVKGTIIESIDVSTLLDVFDDAVMSSLDDNRRIRSTATSAPPTPMLMADIIVIVLLAAELDVAMLDSRSTAMMGKALTLAIQIPQSSINRFCPGYLPSQT